MKKFFTALIIIGLLTGIFFVARTIYRRERYNAYLKEVEAGWHVEILIDDLNVRDLPTKYTKKVLKQVHAGEIYKVIKFSQDEGGNYYWYYIEFYDKTYGWVANNTKGTYLKDVGNENDVAIPIIQYKSDLLKVISVKDIDPDALLKNGELMAYDDRDDYEITYTIYYEEFSQEEDRHENWWIKWEIKDKSGKSSSKLQKIQFEKTPSEGEYDLFINCVRDNGESC